MKKLLWIFLALCVLILGTFALFGDTFEQFFSQQATRDLLREHRSWAGPLGAALLVSDLLLPIPTTVIIGAMGAVIGIGPAVFWGWLGLFLAGLTGYGLARLGGQGWADRLATPEEQIRNRTFFQTWGGLAVILSRMLPILPEALSVTAGLAGMKFRTYTLALLLGSLPPAAAFAWIGATAQQAPAQALWATVGILGLFWLGYRKLK